MVADKVVAKEAASIPVTVPWSSSFGFTASLWRIFLLCMYRQVSTCFRACTTMTCDCAVLPGRNDFCFQTYFDISKVGEKCKYISTRHRHCITLSANAQNCYARWYWPRARNRWEKARAPPHYCSVLSICAARLAAAAMKRRPIDVCHDWQWSNNWTERS